MKYAVHKLTMAVTVIVIGVVEDVEDVESTVEDKSAVTVVVAVACTVVAAIVVLLGTNASVAGVMLVAWLVGGKVWDEAEEPVMVVVTVTGAPGTVVVMIDRALLDVTVLMR